MAALLFFFKKVSNFVVKFLVFFICFYSLFWYFFPGLAYPCFLVIAFLGFCCIFLKKNKLRLNNFLIWFTVFYVLVRAIFAETFMVQAYSVLFCSSCLVYFVLNVSPNWDKALIRLLFCFSLIHVFFTTYAFAFPLGFRELLVAFFPVSLLDAPKLPGILGITPQTSFNAFYITIFISICYASLIAKSCRLRHWVMFLALLLGIFSLILTAKRGIFAANLVSAVFLSLFVSASLRALFSKMFYFASFFFLLIVLLITNFLDIVLLFLRLESGTSGRTALYNTALSCIERAPMGGHGFRYFAETHEIAVHNIYLQIWCDLGMIGLFLFCFFFLVNLFLVCKRIRSSLRLNAGEGRRSLFWSLYMQLFFLVYGISGNPLEDIYIFVIYLAAASIPLTNFNETSKFQGLLCLPLASKQSKHTPDCFSGPEKPVLV